MSWRHTAHPFTHIPQGVADYFWQEASQRRELEEQLLTVFRTWGYGDVTPPMFEYADSLSVQANQSLQSEMIRFLDRDGSTLALRPEMTTPVARLVGTRLHDWPMPQRFCYAGSVFRYNKRPLAGRQREFWQAGVELIGAAGPEADAEILALTVAALDRVHLPTYRLILGQIAYFRGLLTDLALTPDQEAALQQAIMRKSEPELTAFLAQIRLEPGQRRAVEALPDLHGEEVAAIIDRAGNHCLNRQMAEGLHNLTQIVSVLNAYGMADRVHLDLTEIWDLGYYTGITFEVLVPGPGFSIGGGGRYDNLVSRFGPPQPAVGLAFGLDRILQARQIFDPAPTSPRPVAPDLVVGGSRDPRCLELVAVWRSQGLRVLLDVSNRPHLELWDYARRLGCAQALIWTGDGFALYSGEGQNQPVRLLSAQAATELASLL